MDNQTRKSAAKKYYESVSSNEVRSVRMSGKFKGTVVLKVYNGLFKSTGNVWIAFRPEEDAILLCSEVGTHGCGKLSKFI